jgi:hypothetical protein
MKRQFSHHAHDAALHIVARPEQYALTDAQRYDLAQVVRGHTGSVTKRQHSEGLIGCDDIIGNSDKGRGFERDDRRREFYCQTGKAPRLPKSVTTISC